MINLNNLEITVLVRHLKHLPTMSDHLNAIQERLKESLNQAIESKDGAQQMSDTYSDTWQLPKGKIR